MAIKQRQDRMDVLQGTLDMLILKTLLAGPQHGYAIVRRLQLVSEDVLRVEEGSLYPALHRMEQRGYVSSEWATTENNRRARFYSLTRTGRRQLEQEASHWERVSLAIARVMRST